MYSVKSVTNITGINPDTLRAWERRYGVVSPHRDHNGRRIYSAEDIDRLRLLVQACKQGHAISRMAELSNDDIQALIESKSDSQQVKHAIIIERLLNALKNYHSDSCDEILGLAVTGLTPLEAARDIIMPAMREIGEGWHRGELNVAQEHLFSASVRRLVFALLQTYQKQVNNIDIIFATMSGESHEFGILLAALIAASYRIKCHYFGTDLPVADLIHAVNSIQARVVTIGITLKPNLHEFRQQILQLSSHLNRNAEIWIGGTLLDEAYTLQLPQNCRVVQDLDEYQRKIELLREID